MKTFRQILRGLTGRLIVTTIVAATFHLAIEPGNYLYALEVERQKEEKIRAIAAKMNVDPEFLLNPQGRTRFDFRSLFAQLASRFGLAGQSPVATSAQPADVRESIKQVKERYGLVAADTILARITQLVQMSPSEGRGKKKGQIKAELLSVLRLLDKDFLPQVKDGASSVARARDTEMRKQIRELHKRVKTVINAPHALDDHNLEATLTQLRSAVSGTLTVRNSKPRWTRDPFPLKDTYRVANTKPAGPTYGDQSGTSNAATPAVVAQSISTSTAPRLRPAATAVTADVAALASALGTPAKIFTWVHDNIDWESYSGVAKGSLGTLHERRGNDWDQALLLRDLLAARGYDARLEWGRVTLPVAKAMNLVGTEDPMQAANLLATAGFDGLVLTRNNQPIAIQMTHAWVRAHIPYIPNRGATGGTPDTWVRMDPSFKRYEYQPGIAINGKVLWSEDEYLQTSAIRPPAEFYGDKIWSYIRTNNIDCVNLSQVTKAGRIKAANFPFVPATLTTRIDSVAGVNAAPPVEQLQSVTMSVTDIYGAVMASYTASLAELWGKKLSITFPPATAEDAATIESYGGLFNTPAYLIKLKPVFSLDDQPVAEGSAVAAGAVLDLNTTFRQPNVADDYTHHELVAGETHAIVLDAGAVPDSLIEARINRLKTLTNEEAALSEKLFLVGLRYMQHVDDGIRFAAGVRWQRPVKRVFEADVRRQIDITYNVAGAAIRLSPAENNIDVSRLLVGIVPIQNDLSNRAQALALAGLQSSYLEGSIWEEMESQQGISAVKALLLSRIAGQQIHTVDASNVSTVLDTVNLSADVENEIRGAVAQGRIAKIASANLQVNRWNGTGYILQDPQTGAATYPISGGLAGGSTTGEVVQGIRELLGSESWLEGSPLGELLRQLLGMLGGGGDGANEAPSTTQSDPVNLSSGNMHRTATDVSIVARGIPVALTRTYNSRSTYNGPFGYGWTFNYGEQLIANADGSVTYRETDGSEHTFTSSGGAYVAPAGKHLTLSGGAGGWTLTFKDGLQFGFDGAGLLAWQTDLNGNRVTIHRDGSGLPASVVDATGRTVLTFTIAGGKIVEVADLGGRTTIYTYSGDDLVSVTDTAGKSWTMTYDLAHNMTSFADPLGNTQSYAYDTDDRLFHHVDATGAEELFQYDIAGRQSVLTDRRGGDRLVQFDDDGRATLEADPGGNVIRASFDGNNNRTSVVDSRGNTTGYEYDASGNVTRQVSADGGVTTTTYDAQSRPLTTTDATGATTSNMYDASGNLLTSSRTVGGVTETTTNTYDATGQLTSTTDPNGGTTSMTWNENGTLASRTDAVGNTTTIATDALGRITSMKDPAGNTTTLTYDGRDRMLTMADPHGNTTRFAYDAAGRRTEVTTPRGITRYTYDAEGRLVTTTDPLGNKTTTSYNLAGDVVARTDARGNTTRYEYDAVGRVTKMVDANGGVWSYGYCGSIGGSSCSSCGGGGGGSSFCDLTDPNGNTVKQDFDVMGRVIRVTDSLANISMTEYDKAGRKIAETDANGNVTRFAYDEAGRLTSVTEASGAVTSYTYDKSGNKLTQKDANGNIWSFAYDVLNRLVEESDPLGRKTVYTYDTLGNLKTKTDPKGQTTTYTYTIRRLTSVAYADGTSDTFTYDALGRRTGAANANVSYTYAYDALNRIASVHNTRTGYKTAYEYDAAGNRTKLTTLYGNAANTLATTTYAYDAKNRLTNISDTLFGRFTFGYDPMDRRTSLEYPNGITTSYTYDKAYRLTAMVSKDAGGAVADAWSYQYDAAGNRTSRTDMDGKAEIYRYDDVYRLTEAHYAGGTSETFTYDPAGNRLTQTTETGTVASYSYDVANQLLSSGSVTYSYDANGNQVTKSDGTTVTYDTSNRPTRIATPSGTETNQYGPNGERVQMAGASIEGGAVYPQYDTTGNPVTDVDGNLGIWTHRIYGPGIDEPLAEWRRINNRITYLHRDALGSITAVSNTAGKIAYRSTYKAFGQMSRGGYDLPTTRLGYTGRELSVGGLMQYRSRYYDPGQGRFLQQDAYRGSELVPPSLHRYTYVHNNPVVYSDPRGEFIWLAIPPTYNAFDYYLGEQCPQFADCLFAVSSAVASLIAALFDATVLFAALPDSVLYATARWFHDQNIAMHERWRVGVGALWSQSQRDCQSAGWSTSTCCRSRIRAEQRAYTDALATTARWQNDSPFVRMMVNWSEESRVEFAISRVCSCD